MRKTIPALAILLVVAALLSGCSQEETSRTVVSTPEPEQTPEDVLVKEIADGKLVEVYDEYVRMAPGEIVKNWMIISNVKDTDEEFSIIPCGGCDFSDRTVEIPAGEYRIINFKVRAMEGQKEIRVKDSNENAYGHARISVIVE